MRSAHHLADQITTALAEQTVTVPGTASAGEIVSGLAQALAVLLKRRDILEMRVAALLEAHPLAKVLTSMPGVAVRTGARILAEVGDASAFPTAAHLASYAGLTPTTRRSGTSIRGGNKTLKRALFLASFASLSSPESRAYYDRKRAEKKRHNAALICLTRRRVDVLHAMLKHRTLYQPGHEQTAWPSPQTLTEQIEAPPWSGHRQDLAAQAADAPQVPDPAPQVLGIGGLRRSGSSGEPCARAAMSSPTIRAWYLPMVRWVRKRGWDAGEAGREFGPRHAGLANTPDQAALEGVRGRHLCVKHQRPILRRARDVSASHSRTRPSTTPWASCAPVAGGRRTRGPGDRSARSAGTAGARRRAMPPNGIFCFHSYSCF